MYVNFNVFKENIHACNSYYWVVNGETITESGIYFDTLINQFGCDSIMQLDLIISKSGLIGFPISTAPSVLSGNS